MQHNAGASNSTTITISVLVIVLIALGVWWVTNKPASTGTSTAPGTPATGQLQGTVQAR